MEQVVVIHKQAGLAGIDGGYASRERRIVGDPERVSDIALKAIIA